MELSVSAAFLICGALIGMYICIVAIVIGMAILKNRVDRLSKIVAAEVAKSYLTHEWS